MVAKRFRSAITGRFVSKEYAEKHGRTTISERIVKVFGLKKKAKPEEK